MAARRRKPTRRTVPVKRKPTERRTKPRRASGRKPIMRHSKEG